VQPPCWAVRAKGLRGQDGYADRVSRQRFEIVRIGRQCGAVGLSESDHKRVYSRPGLCEATELGCALRDRLRDVFRDVAGLEELIGWGVATGVTLKTLDENNRWNDRWPHAGPQERTNACGHVLGVAGKERNPTGTSTSFIRLCEPDGVTLFGPRRQLGLGPSARVRRVSW